MFEEKTKVLNNNRIEDRLRDVHDNLISPNLESKIILFNEDSNNLSIQFSKNTAKKTKKKDNLIQEKQTILFTTTLSSIKTSVFNSTTIPIISSAKTIPTSTIITNTLSSPTTVLLSNINTFSTLNNLLTTENSINTTENFNKTIFMTKPITKKAQIEILPITTTMIVRTINITENPIKLKTLTSTIKTNNTTKIENSTVVKLFTTTQVKTTEKMNLNTEILRNKISKINSFFSILFKFS